VAKADESERYFRVPMDVRDLNYAKYFVEGEASFSRTDDYTSHNAERLDVAQVKSLLMKLDYIQRALDA
jgi:UDP-glucose 4-epimerase